MLYIYKIDGTLVSVADPPQSPEPKKGEMAVCDANSALYRVEDHRLLATVISAKDNKLEVKKEHPLTTNDQDQPSWDSPIAVANLKDYDPTPGWIRDIETNYMDDDGLVLQVTKDRPDAHSDNDLFWTSFYYIALKLHGELSDDRLARFKQTVQRCLYDPNEGGRYVRRPGKHELTAFDDYVALAAASYVCDPETKIAKDILHYGVAHEFVLGGVNGDLRTLWTRPWLPSFIAIAAKTPDVLSRADLSISLSAFVTDMSDVSKSYTNVHNLTHPGDEAPVFGWLQMRIADDANTPSELRHAIAFYRDRFRRTL